MSRSISARIFAGFLVVILALGGVMGYTLWRMQRVSEELELLNHTYLRLTLLDDRLYLGQENLLNMIDQQTAGYQSPKLVRRQAQLALQFRRREVQTARGIATQGAAQLRGDSGQHALAEIAAALTQMLQRFDENDPVLERVLLHDGAIDESSVTDDAKAILRAEGRLTDAMRQLSTRIRDDVARIGIGVQRDQRAGLWAGLLLVATALLISLAATLLARRTLRPLKALVEGTKRIGRGDYAHRVAATSADELGILAREFNAMAAAIEEREQQLVRSERMAAAGRLASHITHEVRNPLNAIALNSELLEEELLSLAGARAEESRALCQTIQREVDRLTEITEEYLGFARLPKPTLSPRDLNAQLIDLGHFLRESLREKQVALTLDLAPELPQVAMDENQLRQALLNITRNAIEAMPNGGQLTLRSTRDKRDVTLTISDTGEGMSTDVLAQVFDPFFSTKGGGTGLGLALTHQIIQEHGGAIGAQSTVGQGTTFTITLPHERSGG